MTEREREGERDTHAEREKGVGERGRDVGGQRDRQTDRQRQ